MQKGNSNDHLFFTEAKKTMDVMLDSAAQTSVHNELKYELTEPPVAQWTEPRLIPGTFNFTDITTIVTVDPFTSTSRGFGPHLLFQRNEPPSGLAEKSNDDSPFTPIVLTVSWIVDGPTESFTGTFSIPMRNRRSPFHVYDVTNFPNFITATRLSFAAFFDNPAESVIVNGTVDNVPWFLENNFISLGGNSTPPLTVISELFGDFDLDSELDGEDLDFLVMEIASGTNLAQFDLTGEGDVNGADLTEWLAQAGHRKLGEDLTYQLAAFTLDGNVDVDDFNRFNENKFTSTGKWSLADDTADGNTDVDDFNLFNERK